MNRLPFLLILPLLLTASGCAHVVPKNIRQQADPALTFRQVLEQPDHYKEKVVIWGGEIIETVNEKDGTTWIEVFQRPLGWREMPKETVASEGRFLAVANKYLDPYLFQKGRKITVVGEILGEEIRPIGKMDYRYPLLLTKQLYLWEEYYYSPALYSPYYYDPWWGYPYGWGPPYGWRFYYHHRR